MRRRGDCVCGSTYKVEDVAGIQVDLDWLREMTGATLQRRPTDFLPLCVVSVPAPGSAIAFLQQVSACGARRVSGAEMVR